MKRPRGMSFLLDIRRQGFKPSSPVFIRLDDDHRTCLPTIYSDIPLSFEINVAADEEIEDQDFRPLIGLSVAVLAPTLNDRLRHLLKAIQRIKPEFIAGGVPSENLIFAWHPSRGWEFANVER